ncbi:MAG: UDP-N-acetylglucosamine--N-acetylmuramyl-(pentapeptide) pyrophosphoryl-undecaprenol N-acetylglucosamine transferase [bacterium]|nr:UDP-N-acetylglucosamine--N-acetylmuramyl-(pentapeptide) pyrophosphoryl-undecaprenol N-acetylglucosamine transferase [bacterium]MDE0290489.1 UDP-N-acetylglucosamine--N-acetylmuramyl-(pentapeptide) pyrophosphoryl-undecaprenol N-acetylglucosamine transferase [bacterium]MDE0439511.1 UDP-N-acetylglucosamine--N-acetylmuramyl-(pentapeptide) pyrophosphoryl-undecaprenol N-acetylglucosamine transferase [bacterium]
MTFAIAAAGTGGHIYPGLAVAEQLVAAGVEKRHILFLGGDRMEADLIPREGFPFVRLELQGLVRSLSTRNLRLPGVVWKAARRAGREMAARGVASVLCTGGYVTVPVAAAARRRGVPVYLHEQNYEAGLANRLAGRWADRSFVSFPGTRGLKGTVVGYPLRSALADLDRAASRPGALDRYGLDSAHPTLGVVGGSLGASAINQAVTGLAASWDGGPLQVVHLAGASQAEQVRVDADADADAVTRVVVGYENRMDLFYAAVDLLVGRAGGGLMEAAASGIPAILVPGAFGGRHQLGNAQAMAQAGGAVVLDEAGLDSLGEMVAGLLSDAARRDRMSRAAVEVARPGAAAAIADTMLESAHAIPR